MAKRNNEGNQELFEQAEVETVDVDEVVPALEAPENAEEVEVGIGTLQPSDPVQGDELRAPKEMRVFKDERGAPAENQVVVFNESKLDDQGYQRLCAIAGRRLPYFEGGVRAHGFLTCVEANSREQIRVEPGAIFPEGTWVPVNYLPEAFVASLR